MSAPHSSVEVGDHPQAARTFSLSRSVLSLVILLVVSLGNEAKLTPYSWWTKAPSIARRR
ncbi:hypothetical protein EON81_22110 [bacterium]|nr:MAG: hypothetical protein EON81_22110 [bacterium]